MSKERRKVEWSLDFEHLKLRAGQMVSDAMGGTAETKTASLREALEGVTSATIEIAFSVGKASIKALEPGSPNLFEAELTYVGEYEFELSGGAERVIRLRQKSNSASDFGALAGKAQDLRWDIALARNLPLRLRVAGGVGEATLDLSGLNIDALQLDTGVGKALATLPAQAGPLVAEIRGGVGATELAIPADACGKLDIKGGLGSFKVRSAENSAMRVEATLGLGAIHLPERFARVSAEKKARSLRVWQTADYSDAVQGMLITYSGGVGRFDLVTAD